MYTVRLPFSGRQTTREYVISYTRMTVTLTLILNFDLDILKMYLHYISKRIFWIKAFKS